MGEYAEAYIWAEMNGRDMDCPEDWEDFYAEYDEDDDLTFEEAQALRGELYNRMIKMRDSKKAKKIKKYNTRWYKLILSYIDLWQYGFFEDKEMLEIDEFLRKWGF